MKYGLAGRKKKTRAMKMAGVASEIETGSPCCINLNAFTS